MVEKHHPKKLKILQQGSQIELRCDIKNSVYGKKQLTKSSGRNQTIYYFSKDARAQACDLPAGKQVVESPKTGLPFVKVK